MASFYCLTSRLSHFSRALPPRLCSGSSSVVRTVVETVFLSIMERSREEVGQTRIGMITAACADGGLATCDGDDGNAQDNVGGLDLTDEDFRWVTKKLCAAIGKSCPVVSVLEGGYGTWDRKIGTYDRATLASGAAAHVSALAAHVRGRPR